MVLYTYHGSPYDFDKFDLSNSNVSWDSYGFSFTTNLELAHKWAVTKLDQFQLAALKDYSEDQNLEKLEKKIKKFSSYVIYSTIIEITNPLIITCQHDLYFMYVAGVKRKHLLDQKYDSIVQFNGPLGFEDADSYGDQIFILDTESIFISKKTLCNL